MATTYFRLGSFLFVLVAFGLPVAKLLDVIDWSWWVIAAPLWLTLIIAAVRLGRTVGPVGSSSAARPPPRAP